jgi:hypothetical protein
MIGSYYCYDNPSALNKQMEHYFTVLVKKENRFVNSALPCGYLSLGVASPLEPAALRAAQICATSAACISCAAYVT